MATQNEILANAVMQSRLAASLNKASVFLQKTIDEFDGTSGSGFRQWLDEGLNYREMVKVERIERNLSEAAAYFLQAAQALEAEPFVISRPLRINKTNTTVFWGESGIENIDISHYKSHLSPQSPYNPEDDFVFPSPNARHLKSNPQKQQLVKIFKEWLKLYRDVKRVFFTRRELRGDLGEPLAKAVQALRRALGLAEQLSYQGQSRSRSNSSGETATTPSSPYRGTPRRSQREGKGSGVMIEYLSPFKPFNRESGVFSLRKSTTPGRPSGPAPRTYNPATGKLVTLQKSSLVKAATPKKTIGAKHRRPSPKTPISRKKTSPKKTIVTTRRRPSSPTKRK